MAACTNSDCGQNTIQAKGNGTSFVTASESKADENENKEEEVCIYYLSDLILFFVYIYYFKYISNFDYILYLISII